VGDSTNSTCGHQGGGKQPSFDVDGSKKKEFCSEHKGDGMAGHEGSVPSEDASKSVSTDAMVKTELAGYFLSDSGAAGGGESKSSDFYDAFVAVCPP